jgi:hypothetical protein
MPEISVDRLRRLMARGPFSADGSATLPMTVDSESFLRLTVLALSNALGAKDREFLQEAMRRYAHLCAEEAGFPPARNKESV